MAIGCALIGYVDHNWSSGRIYGYSPSRLLRDINDLKEVLNLFPETMQVDIHISDWVSKDSIDEASKILQNIFKV